jgi:Raf kinase inhibitor-like YbhB/YbcL family protein
MAKPFVHWIAYGIPPNATGLPEGIPSKHAPPGSRVFQSKNGARTDGYLGPAPPPGHGVHHYHFQVFALSEPLRFQVPPTREALMDAMRGHIVGYGDLVGTYERA